MQRSVNVNPPEPRRMRFLPAVSFEFLAVAVVLLLAGYLALSALRLAAYLPLLPPLRGDLIRSQHVTHPRHGQTFVVTASRVDRIDLVLRVPLTPNGIPVMVRLRAGEPHGALLMERWTRLTGNGRWQVYAFALPGPLPDGTRKLYFELENLTDIAVFDFRVSRWDRLPLGVYFAQNEVVEPDRDMVLQAYARPNPTMLLRNPVALAEQLFPTAAGPLLLLEVIGVLSILSVCGSHALQQRLPVRVSWRLRYTVDVLIVSGILWGITRFLLSGTYGLPAYWV